MGIRDLASNVALTQSAATTATGTSSVNGAVVDMAGWDGVLFLVKYTTAAANNTMKVQQDTDSGFASDPQDLEGTSVTVGASDEIIWCQVRRPGERYLRPVFLRGTTTVIEWALAIRFGASSLPADNALAGTIAGERHESPAEGTA